MAKWHDLMMNSSRSFRECHDNGGMGSGNSILKLFEVNDSRTTDIFPEYDNILPPPDEKYGVYIFLFVNDELHTIGTMGNYNEFTIYGLGTLIDEILDSDILNSVLINYNNISKVYKKLVALEYDEVGVITLTFSDGTEEITITLCRDEE